MKLLSGAELEYAKFFLSQAQEEAQKSTCLRRKGGAVLVKENYIIGKGFNSPPKGLESQRMCDLDKRDIDAKITDKTCCVHAERRALSDALHKWEDVRGSTMYFTSVYPSGERIFSGNPYCTDCSKNTLDEGVEFWVLEHSLGIFLYRAEEYNLLSYRYISESPQNL